jgi:trimethylamine-N-oxide reductase (cytochrome c)
MTINGAHWGMFYPRVEADRVSGIKPLERDPAPADLIYGIPAAVHAANRSAATRRRGLARSARQS